MSRFWVSWWSSNHIDDGCTAPPVQYWVSGERARDDDCRDYDQSMCAVIDAKSEADIWAMVKRHFPDYEARFCNLVAPDFEPSNRFPGFTGERTRIPTNESVLREALAANAHTAWAGWTDWLFEKWDKMHSSGETFQQRWNRQMRTAYADLPESEKESDRAEADKILTILKEQGWV